MFGCLPSNFKQFLTSEIHCGMILGVSDWSFNRLLVYMRSACQEVTKSY